MRILFIIFLFLSLVLKLLAQNSFQKPFDDCAVKGSITIYDYALKKWITNDLEDSNFGTLPASTFKIVNTLIALESKVVENENEIIPWIDNYDTVKYGHRPNIYHSMSMKEAFQLSAGWVYIELAKKIGKENYHNYLKQIGYGNLDLSIDDHDFWNFGNLAISPSNQIDVLVGIYEETFPFSSKSYKILKDMMIEEKAENYTLRAKTGWTRDKGKDTGWWLGYIERSDNVYFFATRIIKNREEQNPEFGDCRKKITKVILKQEGIID